MGAPGAIGCMAVTEIPGTGDDITIRITGKPGIKKDLRTKKDFRGVGSDYCVRQA